MPNPKRQAGEQGAGTPTAAVLILPDNDRAGMLETLLCDVFADTPEDHCVGEYLDCMEKVSGVPIGRSHKARVHAWLAGQPDPHVSVGVAAKKGYWNLDGEAFGGIRAFLHDL